ncbi:hypothetical protein PhCBS80983_g00224 [Powellomyces hirtus]|uniref:Serine/threonine-protein phosphatase 2A activator n=1 Tax=Powellomyces hirtus TaxID=109895 RepID=A0A507EFN9_9FUNG|nr:hypothetical protein PhCBS80983_g00224 [Powellomyces hirtus]
MPPPGQQHQRQAPQVSIPPFAHEEVHIPSDHQFEQPSKRITDQASLNTWLMSAAFQRLLTFCQKLNQAVQGKKVSDPCPLNETIERILAALSLLDSWIDDIPPQESPQRFGNKAFRTWFDRLEENADKITSDIFPTRSAAVPELAPYFTGSFGNQTRLDYGSGHELSFLAFLACLNILDAFEEEHAQALVTRVFVKYLDLVRRLQKVYTLEPAGSHGVWGLDDHQFLPYLFGSSQLIDHPRLKPKSVLQPDILAHFSNEYLYLAAIASIHEIKTGPFYEHSPILYDITAVPHWRKVNTGMLKMYVAEVLAKLPVVQHLPFGSLLPFDMPAEAGVFAGHPEPPQTQTQAQT